MSRLMAIAIGSLSLAVSAITPANAAIIPSGSLGLLAAGERASVFAATTGNNTTTHNGSEWYFWDGNSMGFALEGAVVSLDSADTNGGAEAWSRLSWHIHGEADATYVGNGYRVGADTGYNSGEDAATTGRFIFTADTLPGYYPSGPQENVDVADLDGWTLCWSNTYDNDTLELGSLDNLLAECDGEYIMLAAGVATEGEFADFNGTDEASEEEVLAETGFDASFALGAAAALAAAGIAVVVRRRRA